MQAVTCPFNYNACGTTTSKVILSKANQTTTITTVPKIFTTASMCYYKIQMQNQTLDIENYTYDVQITFNQANNVNINLNNGTSP